MTVSVYLETPGRVYEALAFESEDGDTWTIRYPSGKRASINPGYVLGGVINAIRTPSVYRLSVDGELVSGSKDDSSYIEANPFARQLSATCPRLHFWPTTSEANSTS